MDEYDISITAQLKTRSVMTKSQLPNQYTRADASGKHIAGLNGITRKNEAPNERNIIFRHEKIDTGMSTFASRIKRHSHRDLKPNDSKP